MEITLVGGGLANGLIALRLLGRADVSFELHEASDSLGGNHTWSFHASDVTPEQLQWLEPLITKRWSGYDVAFHSYRRTLSGEYCSISSRQFDQVLRERLGHRVRLGSKLDVSQLEDRLVIDGRGFGRAVPWPSGYQSFLGLDVTVDRPHGLSRPLLMDCRVEQLDAFRFMYLLPWSERQLLIEDTSYANAAALDKDAVRRRIERYLADRGLRIERVDRQEMAALPIPLSGDAPTLERPTVGVAAGFFHATTGYSLPFAARIADLIASDAPLEPAALTELLTAKARTHWRSQALFRLLNRMLFRGAAASERVRIFESFYRHDEALIARFYAAQLGFLDVLTVLARGSTTVPGHRALKAALSG